MILGICCITKNPKPIYLSEWMYHHVKLGVDHFYFWDSGCNPQLTDIIPKELLYKCTINKCGEWNKGRAQLSVYRETSRQIVAGEVFKSDMVAFIDDDEFLMSFGDLKLNLINYEEVGVCWHVMGSSGLVEEDDKKLFDKFIFGTQPTYPGNRYVKTICKPEKSNKKWPNPHMASSNLKDTIGRRISTNAFAESPIHYPVWIRHFWTKSMHEFLNKIEKRKFSDNNKISIQEFHDVDSFSTHNYSL